MTGSPLHTPEFPLADDTPDEFRPTVSITRTNGTRGVSSYAVVAARSSPGGKGYRATLATVPEVVDGARQLAEGLAGHIGGLFGARVAIS